MNMKKIAITALLGMSVVGLTGCDADTDDVKKAKAKMNTLEMVLYNNADSVISTAKYTDILVTISKRPVRLHDSEAPFCDVADAISALEKIYFKGNSFKYSITHQTNNFALCDQTSDTIQYINTKDDNTVVVENGDTQEEILSPKVIDEITEASVECFSAKVKMVDIIDDKGYLTKQDYPEVMKLISKCKMHKLRVEVESN